METFSIAKLNVRFEAAGDLLYTRTRAYLAPKQDAEADITIDLPESFFEEKHRQFPTLTVDECRYVWVGEAFYAGLLRHDGLLMHASCVERAGGAYLFSAKSGTGKSTHTKLWLQEFSDCKMINDDKPALRRLDGRFYACGTPFSGKNDESRNVQVPVRAIVFLERGEQNEVTPLAPSAAIPLFLSQTLRPPKTDLMAQMLDLLGDLLEHVPAFRLRCNMDPSAAHIAYQSIENYIQNHEKEGSK